MVKTLSFRVLLKEEDGGGAAEPAGANALNPFRLEDSPPEASDDIPIYLIPIYLALNPFRILCVS